MTKSTKADPKKGEFVKLVPKAKKPKPGDTDLFTLEEAIGDLEEDRQMARSAGQSSAAISATMHKAKLVGLMRDRPSDAGEDVTKQTIYELPDNGRSDDGKPKR